MNTKSATVDATKLPRPEELPQADVLLYDSACRICTQQVKRLARWDTARRVSYLPLDDPQVSERWPHLKYEDLMHEMHLIEIGGTVHRGAAAFRYLTTRLPRLYALAPLLHLPCTLSLWQWCYQQIARRRYRFGRTHCDGGTCHLHG